MTTHVKKLRWHGKTAAQTRGVHGTHGMPLYLFCVVSYSMWIPLQVGTKRKKARNEKNLEQVPRKKVARVWHYEAQA
jgi:hypothetical protein